MVLDGSSEWAVFDVANVTSKIVCGIKVVNVCYNGTVILLSCVSV